MMFWSHESNTSSNRSRGGRLGCTPMPLADVSSGLGSRVGPLSRWGEEIIADVLGFGPGVSVQGRITDSYTAPVPRTRGTSVNCSRNVLIVYIAVSEKRMMAWIWCVGTR